MFQCHARHRLIYGMCKVTAWRPESSKSPSQGRLRRNHRLDTIDLFRGIAVLLMVLATYLSRIQRVPPWLKHAPLFGLTGVDLIAPLFIFAMGLGFRPSLQRRLARDGRWPTVLHFIRRFLALIGLGVLTPPGYDWGLFQTIGTAGLLNLLVIRLPTLARGGIGLVMLGGYQILWNRPGLTHSPTSIWCEREGVFGWAAMLLLATVLADLYHDPPRGRKAYLWGTLSTLVLGIILSTWVPISRHYVSASFVLISLGASGVLFAACHLLIHRLHLRLPLLIAWGRNPLVLYLLQYWLWVLIFLRPASASWHLQAPLWLILLQAAGFVLVLSLVARFLDRRGWYVSL